jgi:hypothetical protein
LENPALKFSFEVGVAEKHTVDFDYDAWLGNLSIKVDGREVTSDRLFISLSLTKTYAFRVGSTEQHTVTIEKKRKLFLAGLRPQRYRVYVDGQLIREYVGI